MKISDHLANNGTHRSQAALTLSNVFRKLRVEDKETKENINPYTHESIDYKQSTLRLIRVHPRLSQRRNIQCSISHATIKDKYTCISYVWGPNHVKHMIEINGQAFYVQSNLFKFLQVARKQYPGVPFWIDALSIDQENNHERNHQVQQMGSIYSQASCVLAWMGYDTVLTSFLQQVAKWHRENPTEYLYSRMQFLDFGRHPHWSRAWITQETLLAQDLKFVAPGVEVLFTTLLDVFPSHYFDDHELHFVHQRHLGKKYIKGRDLMYLLYLFRGKHCAVPRDKVYSLLSLCGYGAALEVDYRISDQSLFQRIFLCCPQNVCLCTFALVAETLLASDDATSSYDGRDIIEAQIKPQRLLKLQSDERKAQCRRCSFRASIPASWKSAQDGYMFCLIDLCPNNCVHIFWHTKRAPGSKTILPKNSLSRFLAYDAWIVSLYGGDHTCVLDIEIGPVCTVRLGLYSLMKLLNTENLRVCTRIERELAGGKHNPGARLKIL